jgi:hypothetical protein
MQETVVSALKYLIRALISDLDADKVLSWFYLNLQKLFCSNTWNKTQTLPSKYRRSHCSRLVSPVSQDSHVKALLRDQMEATK